MTRVPLPQMAPATATPPTAPQAARDGLRDAHGRRIGDLRLSVTDRCNFRCTYCMEPDERFLPKQQLLDLQNYLHIIDTAIELGVTKLRLTGGEPTLYPDLDALIDTLATRTLDDVAMTTNGWRLSAERAGRWLDGGLDRLTFSLDTLRDDRMAAITRTDTPVTRVLTSIYTARQAGFPRPKVNVVLQQGVNDDEATAFARLARSEDLDIRFIEFMPLDGGRHWQKDTVVSAADTRAAIDAVFPLAVDAPSHAAETAVNWTFADGAPGRLGFIAPVSSPFCGACNRLRITAEGMVRPCLFSSTEWDLRPVLQARDQAATAAFLQNACWTKQAGHGIGRDDFARPDRPMRAIGG